jgi:hypothetical protein
MKDRVDKSMGIVNLITETLSKFDSKINPTVLRVLKIHDA